MIEKLSLYILAAFMIVSAIGAVSLRNIFHAALLLGVALLSIAGIYLLLGAELLAAVQVLVYIGGILTLIIFAIMFTKNLSDKCIQPANKQKAVAFLISFVTLGVLVFGIRKMPISASIQGLGIVDARAIGKALFLDYALAFEVLSVILLIALVGAIILARKEAAND